ncbi:MAG: pyridoxal phosphate-dependent aminotransferase [Planctomycetes bacterium]|nr:pyridoxal phosphate-dependent aminotransferase [Planctomycetota bacterium]MCC7171756.1 pyridoxal phosphate-dependent aminotransferase [Planctomycetota bacterium]
MRFEFFEYMRWAKVDAGRGEIRLTSSGLSDLTLADLQLCGADLSLTPDGYYPPPKLTEAYARHYGVPGDCVFATASCSYANAMALLATVESGDDVLVETPCYSVLEHLVRFAGGNVVALPRRPERGYRLGPDDLAAVWTPRTRLVALTNLHNPTGVRLSATEIDALGAFASARGAVSFVDEVFLDFAADARTSFRPGQDRIVTTSVTKAYGLGGIRIGAVFADPPRVERMVRLNDLFVVNPPWPSTPIALRLFERHAAARARIDAIGAANRPLLRAFFDAHDELDVVWPEHGIVCFPRFRDRRDASPFCERLLAEQSVNVVPGRFFGATEHVRLGFGLATEVLREGLARIGRALRSG